MIEFMKSENFIKLTYLIVFCGIIAFGFVNKHEVIELYKMTLSVCS